jgi:formylglycine-generating enzyme required for sulfatase activity
VILPYTLFLALNLADAPPAEEPVRVEDGYGNPRLPRSPRPVKKQPARTKPSPQKPARCPAGMTYVARGKFRNKPIAGFCLDIKEVTIAEFEEYLRALDERSEGTKAQRAALRSALRRVDWSGLDPSQASERDKYCTWHMVGKSPELPINCVSHAEAEAYCANLGKRLPSEREWQWAARGGRKGSPYSWGSARPGYKRLNMAESDGTPQLVPVRAYDPGAFGLYDMAGNVWEWTAGDPAATGCHARGGGYRSLDPAEVRATSVLEAGSRRHRSDEVGFRCAASIQSTDATP